MNIQAKRSRFLTLDGLRGFAAVCVALFHYDHDLMPGGYLAVDFFFALSGFVLTKTYTRRFAAGLSKGAADRLPELVSIGTANCNAGEGDRAIHAKIFAFHRKDDVILAVAPLYHIAGMICGLTLLAYTGATVVLLNRMDPLAVLQAIERHRVTWWYAMAPMLVSVMNEPGADGFDLSSLQTTMGTSFGIKLTEELARRWSCVANGCLVYEAGYGLSETHTNDVLMPRNAVRWGTNGIPCPGVQLKIVAADGFEVPAGNTGEIVLKSLGVFKGYWNRTDATAEVLRNGWVHTGDIGKVDADGYVTFIGRIKEMIKVSGFSVFPEEVEAILILHPDVAQVAAIGMPDPDKGEVVKAFIVPKQRGKLDVEQLIAWARANMSYYKVPRVVEVLDALPATGAGKVLRRLLRGATVPMS